eukprot:306555-Pleurochrysis_carterae.AAC.2
MAGGKPALRTRCSQGPGASSCGAIARRSGKSEHKYIPGSTCATYPRHRYVFGCNGRSSAGMLSTAGTIQDVSRAYTHALASAHADTRAHVLAR